MGLYRGITDYITLVSTHMFHYFLTDFCIFSHIKQKSKYFNFLDLETFYFVSYEKMLRTNPIFFVYLYTNTKVYV